MNDLHTDLHLYVDGELPGPAAERFRDHLATCSVCQRELSALLYLEVGAARAVARRFEPWAAVKNTLSSLKARWRLPVALTGVAAVAASLLLTFQVRELRMAGAPSRPLEMRLPSQPYQRFSPSRGGEELLADPPLLALAWLQWRKDLVGLAEAYLLRGQTQAAQRYLDRAEESADALATRAALDLRLGKPEDAVRDAYEATRLQGRHPAALWNQALALRGMQLPLAAAQELDEVAALAEPGWSDEARVMAAQLREESARRKQRYEASLDRYLAALRGEQPYPVDVAGLSPRMARLWFYDAVRAAGTAEALAALEPAAAALDARFGGRALARFLAAATASASRARPELSRAYASARERKAKASELAAPADPGQWMALADAARAARQPDIELGALYFVPPKLLDLARYQALALATSDPWFATLAEEKAAQVDRQQGQPVRALERLRPIWERCRTSDRVEDRCPTIERAIAFNHALLHHTLEASGAGLRALARAREENDLPLELNVLAELGQVSRLRSELGLAHAYLGELLARDPASCEVAESARSELAIAHQRVLDFPEVRRQVDLLARMDREARCERPPSQRRMFAIADLQRIAPRPEDEAVLKRGAEAALANPRTSPGARALVTHILGRAKLEHDRAEGERLLRQAIAEAERIPGTDRAPEKARLYSYTSLILDAGKRGDWAGALRLFAEERGWASPPSCSVWLTLDDERLLAIAVDPSGKVLGRYDGARTRPPMPADALVPSELRAAVSPCPAVQVIARPPLEGRPGLLPTDMAWSEVVRLGLAPPPPGNGPRVVVASPSAPASLALPALSAPPRTGDAVWLEGPAATPARVMEAARDASLLELHVHGLVVPEVADASHLVLSPDASGEYALTARAVRREKLAGHPLVLLAACDSGETLSTLHEGFGLPAAFVKAGARAVLAVTAKVPDLESELFFRPLLKRILAGEAPALALREARVAWQKDRGPSWVDSVLLVE